MNEKIPPFLKKDGNVLKFNTLGEFVFYVPEDFFAKKHAIVSGEYINLFGILDYSVFDEKGKSVTGLKQFRFPTSFLCKPGDMEKSKDVKLTKDMDAQDYRLLKFKKGDEIVSSIKVPQSVSNVEEFHKLINGGRFPTSVKYTDVTDYFIENATLNGFNYGMSIQLIGLLISELCVDPKDSTKLFRLSPNSNTNLNGYKMLKIKDKPKHVSPFTSVTSENWDDSIVNAVLNKSHKPSPLERLFM